MEILFGVLLVITIALWSLLLCIFLDKPLSRWKMWATGAYFVYLCGAPYDIRDVMSIKSNADRFEFVLISKNTTRQDTFTFNNREQMDADTQILLDAMNKWHKTKFFIIKEEGAK